MTPLQGLIGFTIMATILLIVLAVNLTMTVKELLENTKVLRDIVEGKLKIKFRKDVKK